MTVYRLLDFLFVCAFCFHVTGQVSLGDSLTYDEVSESSAILMRLRRSAEAALVAVENRIRVDAGSQKKVSASIAFSSRCEEIADQLAAQRRMLISEIGSVGPGSRISTLQQRAKAFDFSTTEVSVVSETVLGLISSCSGAEEYLLSRMKVEQAARDAVGSGGRVTVAHGRFIVAHTRTLGMILDMYVQYFEPDDSYE